MNSDGSELFRVTHSEADEITPQFSKDSKTLSQAIATASLRFTKSNFLNRRETHLISEGLPVEANEENKPARALRRKPKKKRRPSPGRLF